jgi:SPP1 family predicted phage head-tail adaptor
MMKETHPFTAGEFRSPILVERGVETADGSGGQTIVWSTYIATIWCHVEEWHGNESYGDNSTARIRTIKTLRFTTWYRTDIQVTDRFIFEGQWYNIRRVDNLLRRNKFSQYTAEAGVEQ